MNKTKYLITDAWNGEGYSDSDIEILEVENYPGGTPKQEKLKKKLINRITNLNNLKSIEITDNSVTYQIDNDCQDAGTYHFEPLTEDIIAVAIFPNICGHEVIRDIETLEKYKTLVRKGMIEDDYLDEDNIFGYCSHSVIDDDLDLILREV
tara:strand:+ start:619 stop:1071 length:453 start_codon:yes stop_codon:yes gene_type:complete